MTIKKIKLITEGQENYTKKPRTLADAGMISAICIGVFDLGYQKTTWDAEKDQKGYEGKKVQRQILVTFEIDQTIDNKEHPDYGKRLVISTPGITFTINEKGKLYKFYKSWMGEDLTAGIDIADIFIGRPALLNIVHTKSKKDESITYANIENITPLPKGMKALEMENVDWKAPTWIQDRINKQIPKEQIVAVKKSEK